MTPEFKVLCGSPIEGGAELIYVSRINDDFTVETTKDPVRAFRFDMLAEKEFNRIMHKLRTWPKGRDWQFVNRQMHELAGVKLTKTQQQTLDDRALSVAKYDSGWGGRRRPCFYVWQRGQWQGKHVVGISRLFGLLSDYPVVMQGLEWQPVGTEFSDADPGL